MWRYTLLWFPLLLIAIGNGILREKTFAKVLPELRSHQLSTLIGAAFMGLFIWFAVHTWPPSSTNEAIIIGVVWLCMTVAFEFYMGLVLQKRPMSEVLAQYNLMKGHLWVLLLGWITTVPWFFYWLS